VTDPTPDPAPEPMSTPPPGAASGPVVRNGVPPGEIVPPGEVEVPAAPGWSGEEPASGPDAGAGTGTGPAAGGTGSTGSEPEPSVPSEPSGRDDEAVVGQPAPGTAASKALGWFSLALGAGALAAPQALGRTIGVEPTAGVVRVLRFHGVREVVAGAAILKDPADGSRTWVRVGGDLLDLATLGAFAGAARDRVRLGMAATAVAGVTAVDVVVARRLP
jgi:hypothetical protein